MTYGAYRGRARGVVGVLGPVQSNYRQVRWFTL